ncbi:hypothetical protein H920_11955 [Fukomys damarensis]|uniref:Uncharacterized protein n=1 Tax=Fukomys damarensis TaxID=885580 RepID=A0A091DUT9_FUKDA|nr:hypothetical protein H920_11955 [Fukomys damarensis]
MPWTAGTGPVDCFSTLPQPSAQGQESRDAPFLVLACHLGATFEREAEPFHESTASHNLSGLVENREGNSLSVHKDLSVVPTLTSVTSPHPRVAESESHFSSVERQSQPASNTAAGNFPN